MASVERAIRECACVLVAEIDGRLVGTVIGGFDGWRGNLYRLAVVPEYRLRGVASSLVADAERVLRERGVRRVTALVERKYEHATGFWTAVGYLDEIGKSRFVRTL